MEPAVKAAHLDGLTPHGLRHTAASLYISAWHAAESRTTHPGPWSIAITLDLYGHLYPDEMDTWASRLGEIAESMWPERGQNGEAEDGEPPSSLGAGR